MGACVSNIPCILIQRTAEVLTPCCVLSWQNVSFTASSYIEPTREWTIAPPPLERDARAHTWQDGGGLYIVGTATLTNTNVYTNEAGVGAYFEHSLNLHPAPRWNVTCALGWQDGGGLYITGTATLTNTNVYENQAGRVRSAFGHSLIFIQRPTGT